MTPGAYLANAIRIHQAHAGQPDASASRAIIHACYYGVFHLAIHRLRLNPDNRTATSHANIGRKVSGYAGSDPALNEAKFHLGALREARMRADYRLRRSIGHAEAGQSIKRATRIFAAAGIIPTVV